MENSYIGHKTWAIPGCCIPAQSSGEEPLFTSRDEICILNTGGKEIRIEITIYYHDRDPVGPYQMTVSAQRLRCIRFNDLIDPEAIILETEFAAVLKASRPVVVQFNRIDSGNSTRSHSTTIAFPIV